MTTTTPIKYTSQQVLDALKDPKTECSIVLPTKMSWSDDKFLNRLTINGIVVEFEGDIMEILQELNGR